MSKDLSLFFKKIKSQFGKFKDNINNIIKQQKTIEKLNKQNKMFNGYMVLHIIETLKFKR